MDLVRGECWEILLAVFLIEADRGVDGGDCGQPCLLWGISHAPQYRSVRIPAVCRTSGSVGRDFCDLLDALRVGANQGPGSEVYLATFDSIADIIAGTQSALAASQIDVAGLYSIAGLTHDMLPPTTNPEVIPLPASFALLLGALSLLTLRRRRRS